MKQKIMLLDGNSIMNRAFYALPLLTNKDGVFTNGVYGFLNIFFKLFDEENPDYLAVCFDLPKPTFRHEMFAEYKGTRKSMPDELRPQFPILKELLKKMNISIFEMEGYEADDVLGTIAKTSEREGLNVTLVSGDRDLLQVCTENILVRIPKTKGGKTEVENYYEKDVIEKIGVSPLEYIDVKALMGDSSDNIPGIEGIGEKTALKIIKEYRTIDEALKNTENIKPKKCGENLLKFKDIAYLSKELATINVSVPVEIELKNLKCDSLYNKDSYEEVKRLNFTSHLKRFIPKETETVVDDYEIPDEWVSDVKEVKEISPTDFISNTKSTLYFALVEDKKGIKGISLCNENNDCVFVIDENYSLFKELFESSIEKICYDYKKCYSYLEKYGINLTKATFDIMLAMYLIDSNKGATSLEDIGNFYLNISSSNLNFVLYGEIVKKVYPLFLNDINENNYQDLYFNIEFVLSDVLLNMEKRGIKVDKNALIKYGEILSQNIEKLTQEIYDLSGQQFNINSPSQLGVVLFEKLGLKAYKKTKTGYSTAADVLEKLANDHPIINKISEYRNMTKLKSTYVDGLLNEINENGKIHTTFLQTIASTGRLTSVEPNLQNIPIRLPLGRELRKIFVPSSDDFVFLDADYSQIELRVLAHMSGDETLIDAFKNDLDIHKITASQVFDTPFDLVTDLQRSNAKAVNFGIVYGIGSFSLSEDLHITNKEAKEYIDGYFSKYPKVKSFMDDCIKNAKDTGYAITSFNRRRPIPEILSSNFNIRSFGERIAMNMPIQGTAADIIKIAMIKVYEKLKNEKVEAYLVLQVHDELLLEVKKSDLEFVENLLKEEMTKCVSLSVPLTVSCNVGKNWYDTK